jgi:hypothetical protein
MTAPVPAPFDPSAEQDALSHISRMMVGTKVLQNQPGLVYTLAQQRANPADAQAIDQFLQSLEAEKRVSLARATGDQVVLSDREQAMLDTNGVPYKDVQYTQQDAAQAASKKVLDASGGKYTAATNPDGTLALDDQGQIQPVAVHKETHDSGGGGILGAIGGAFESVGSGIKAGLVGTLHGLNKAWNFVNGVSHENPFTQPSLDDALHGDFQVHVNTTQADDMRQQGYDPTSIWSHLAFDASGKRHTDLSDLIGSYGQDKVDEALQFLNDPKAYRQGVENDPSNWTVTTDGQKALTPEAQAKIHYLGSKEFESLARRINAHSADAGHDIANALGLDPVKHSTTYGITAAVGNITAGFLIDPTLLAFRAGQAVKISQVGIDTLSDTSAASILTKSGVFASNVQRGWKHAITLGDQFRSAGTDAERAAITAKFRAELPGLEPIMDNFTGGEHVFQGFHPTETELVDGRLVPKAIFGASDGIRSLEDAQSFVSSNWGLLRLMNGRAATQSGLMPGALSAFGYRKLKGLTASWMTTRSVNRATNAVTSVLNRAGADPALAKKLLDDGTIANILPESDDAIHFFSGAVLAAPRAAGDAGEFAVTQKGLGQIKQNLRATGDALGDSSLGRFSPTAISERFRQAAIRFSTQLPRNTVIDMNDARSGDILYKTAMTYLNRGEANTFRALWNVADAGTRKTLVHGLLDQLGHAAGLGKTETGQALLARLKTQDEAYFASGSEIELNGNKIAGFEGQTRTRWMLPSFNEMQKAANRIGLYETTFGRAMKTGLADEVMSLWKFGALFKPSTVSRNMLEGWLRTMLEGRAGSALKARAVATMKNKELWSRGHNLDSEEYATYKQALAGGNTDLAKQIENSSMLDGQTLGRSVASNWLANTAPLALVGRTYRYLVGKHMDEETLNALLSYGHQDLQLAMEGYGLQLMEYELGWRNAAKQATETANAGFGPSKLRFALKRNRSRADGAASDEEPMGIQWTHKAIDGVEGAERYASNLARRVNAMPETTKAAIKLIRLGSDSAGRGEAMRDLVSSLERESKNTAFGKVYFPDINNFPNTARNAATADEVEAGKLDWANKVASEYRYLLTGQNGKFQEKLADYLTRHGQAPDGDWIAGNIVNDDRPESALAPIVMAMAPGGPSKLAELLQDVEGTAYQFFIERPLQRLTSAPVFLSHYAIARKGLNPMIEQMVEGGMDRVAAENLAKDLATRNAWVKTEQLIDDPGQKTQFDVVARNFFPFARATQAMIRRWATGLWQNPVAARKMMLAYEGAVHSGLIYNNAYGEPTFTYPGSGVMNLAMRGLAEVPGFENFARFPIAGDMQGQVLMSVPGADNPFRMGMGPMISVPFREIYTSLFPYLHAHLGLPTTNAQEQLASVDRLINGPIGQGETWSQFVPTAVRKFYVALSGDQRNSAMASAMNGAIANLASAGLLPAPDASSEEKQRFLHRLQTQVKSQLFIRAVFGLFSPAAPSSPSEGTSGSGADYAWSLDGIKQLSDEYKVILNDVEGDVARANAVFTALHPDDVVYDPTGDLKSKFLTGSAMETTRSGAVTPGAYLPSTDSTLQWMDRHTDLISKYGSVAAYFLPEQTASEPFSDAAYKTQIEFGLRMRKSPSEFLKDIYVKHAEATFYPADKALNAKIAQARLAGDSDTVKSLTAQRHDWLQKFKSLNPYFADKLDDYGSARKTANGQLSDLRQMLKNGETPDGLDTKLKTLVQAYDNYSQFLNDHQGTDAVNTAAKQHALQVFNQWADESLAGTPLANVFNGVFRVLNSNFDKVNGSTDA